MNTEECGNRPEFAAAVDAATCWNGFCVLAPHEDDDHVDATGDTWAQQRGTRYCAECGGYTACDHPQTVVTIYE